MSLVLTEEQELIKQGAAEFLNDHSPVTHLREMRDSEDPVGFSKKIWKEMAELGWAGIPFDEDVGGAGLGLADLGVVLEAELDDGVQRELLRVRVEGLAHLLHQVLPVALAHRGVAKVGDERHQRRHRRRDSPCPRRSSVCCCCGCVKTMKGGCRHLPKTTGSCCRRPPLCWPCCCGWPTWWRSRWRCC